MSDLSQMLRQLMLYPILKSHVKIGVSVIS